jgi:hypothetical protein
MLQPQLGADLYGTIDGWHYTMISRTGLGDGFNNGIRNLASTPYGLFLGTANHTHGARIYRSPAAPEPLTVAAPLRLEVERTTDAAMLTWEGSPTAVRFHVFRDSGFALPAEMAVVDARAPEGRLFIDRSVKANVQYRYSVVAEDEHGARSGPSNTVRIPVVGPVPTFVSLEEMLQQWQGTRTLITALRDARSAVARGDYAGARYRLQAMRTRTRSVLSYWRVEDLDVLLEKFIRRVQLVEAWKMDPSRLSWLP